MVVDILGGIDYGKLIDTLFTKDVEKVVSNGNIDPSSYTDVVIDVPNTYSGMLLIVRATFDSGATSFMRVIYMYSADGLNYDSEDEAISAGNYFEFGAAGETRQRSEIIPAIAPYIKIRLRNLDSVYNITNINVWRVFIR